MKNILVVAAHPDDEILGCGATIAKFAKQGSKVNILIVSEGITSRDKFRDIKKRHNQILKLRKSAKISAKKIGAKSINFLSFPDNRLDNVPLLEIIKNIESFIFKFKPDTIFTHSSHDLNIDHLITNKATLTACRPIPNSSIKKILTFEILSSTEYNPNSKFKPNYFVDIDKFLKKKINSLKEYKSEMRGWPHPRSIKSVKNLAEYRGSNIGIKYAEAFELLRHIS